MSINKDLSPNIRSFLQDLFDAFEEHGLTHVLLRNYDGLPFQIGFDLDVLVPQAQQEKVQSLLKVLSEQTGIYFKIQNKKKTIKVALFDFNAADHERGWIMLDLQMVFPVGNQSPYTIENIDRQKINSSGFNFYAPSSSWQFVLDIIQDLRKGRSITHLHVKCAEVIAQDDKQVLSTYMPDGFIEWSCDDDVSTEEWSQRIQNYFGIEAYKEGKNARLNWRDKFSRYVFYKNVFCTQA